MYKVMIVDDMEIVRLQLKRMKIWGEVSGFQITDEARNGYEAMIKLQINPVDLIITDICMPIVDGVELLEEVMKKKLAICVVFLSEYSEFEYARQGLVLGAFDYLVKPVNRNDIDKLLERAKLFITKKKGEKKKLMECTSLLDIEQVLELFECGKSAESLVCSSFDKLFYEELDNIKIYHMIRSSIEELLEAISINMPWLMKFADVNSINRLKYYDLNSLEELKNNYIFCIQSLEEKINYLYLAKSYGSLINKISIFVLQNVENQISLSMIANNLHMSKNYLCETFKKKTGISLLDYMTKAKMERAKKMLKQSENKSYEIADKLGYKDTEYFSKLFKKYSGISPTEYRKLKKI